MGSLATETLSRRERKSAEIRDRLFVKALELFAKQGYQQTTVEDITEAADVGKGTFFNYFPSKEHLLLAFGEKQVLKLAAALEMAKASQMPMREFLGRLAAEMTAAPAKNPSVLGALLMANLSSERARELMRELQMRGLEMLSKIMEIGQERGEIRRDMAPAELASATRQMMMGTLLLWSLYADNTLEARIAASLKVLWDGLATKESGANERNGEPRNV